jgi:hypothetical protein
MGAYTSIGISLSLSLTWRAYHDCVVFKTTMRECGEIAPARKSLSISRLVPTHIARPIQPAVPPSLTYSLTVIAQHLVQFSSRRHIFRCGTCYIEVTLSGNDIFQLFLALPMNSIFQSIFFTLGELPYTHMVSDYRIAEFSSVYDLWVACAFYLKSEGPARARINMQLGRTELHRP